MLDIQFEEEIEAWEVPSLRGAVVATVGKENILFHNHSDTNFRYSYPLIQYKRVNKKPHLICIEQGVDEVYRFFENKQEGIMLGKRLYELKVEKLSLNSFTMQVWDKSFDYFMQEWLPLNQKNFVEYAKLNSELERLEFLEKILIGNILSFAKGLEWNIESQIKLRIKNIVRTSFIKVKDVKREAFTINFSTNIFLPNHIGLGKNASIGFGVVKSVNDKK
ncbi:MAG TPA: hypothetical protein DCG69_06540 [Bacteroidales bacterium]|nr:hypothetical protein [Bacteroidales bacterium]